MRDMALKMSRYFYLMMEKPLGCYFQVCSPFYQAVQCNHKTPIPLSSRAQVRSKKTKKISSLITAASIYRCNKYIYPIRYFQCCTITVRVTNEGERDTMSCPYEARLIPLDINPIFKCLQDKCIGTEYFLFYTILFLYKPSIYFISRVYIMWIPME